MNLFKILNGKDYDKVFEKNLEQEMSKPRNENDIYNEISRCYYKLLKLLNVNSLHSFKFSDYENCRTVIINGSEYNFDNVFCHDDALALEIMCEIDSHIADLSVSNIELVLKKIEQKVNDKNYKI